ncbi:MAG: NUDIX domain-containing protein [Alphaproteobacteria bacterium]|nr:NUDIX domain-containing protein [Alphaproteobacteria bacterium]
MSERVKFNASVSFIIKQDNKFLLFYRTDGYFKDGWWVLPAGHIESDETATQAVVREAKEELGIDVDIEDVEFAHIVHNLVGENKRMDFYFIVKKFNGTVQNLEPSKCSKMLFFDKDNLPSIEKIAPTTYQALQNIWNKKTYSERQ